MNSTITSSLYVFYILINFAKGYLKVIIIINMLFIINTNIAITIILNIAINLTIIYIIFIFATIGIINIIMVLIILIILIINILIIIGINYITCIIDSMNITIVLISNVIIKTIGISY